MLSFVFAAAVLYPDDQHQNFLRREIISSILDTHADTVQTDIMGNDYSVGYIFSPKVSGKITRLGIKLPDSGIFKISIWDVETKTLIAQTTVHQGRKQWNYKDIPDVSVVKQKNYVVCLMLPLGTQYFTAPNLKLPLNAHGVKVVQSVASFGDAYPADQIMPDALFGFIDFTFEPSY